MGHAKLYRDISGVGLDVWWQLRTEAARLFSVSVWWSSAGRSRPADDGEGSSAASPRPPGLGPARPNWKPKARRSMEELGRLLAARATTHASIQMVTVSFPSSPDDPNGRFTAARRASDVGFEM